MPKPPLFLVQAIVPFKPFYSPKHLILLVLNAGNGWEWGLLGFSLIILITFNNYGSFPHSLRETHQRQPSMDINQRQPEVSDRVANAEDEIQKMAEAVSRCDFQRGVMGL